MCRVGVQQMLKVVLTDQRLSEKFRYRVLNMMKFSDIANWIDLIDYLSKDELVGIVHSQVQHARCNVKWNQI